ncbi:MAG: diaminopimelate epimerase [Chloroflexi bacterium]|nr:diaminopimelate epimerase [Chloroflexota bacterium]
MEIPFSKMQGTGNDFVLIDGRTIQAGWAELAPSICDRHFGVGADGLLVVEESGRAALQMRLFNADGSEAEMCGNGLRCVVKWALEQGGAVLRDGALAVETGAGVVSAVVTATAADQSVERVRLSMGAPRLEPEEIPVCADGPGPVMNLPIAVNGTELAVTCVSLGNPHAVHFVDGPLSAFALERLGPLVERHDRFPQRTNFEVVHVESPERLHLRVWERGAGPTLACGSGAAAGMVAARLHGLVGERVTVSLPGGDLDLSWDGEGSVSLEGPAERVFEGQWITDRTHDGHP